MKTGLIVVGALILILGCARVSVQAPKDPIKVDISMRLDIYQHIKNDIDDIESLVTGSSEKTKGQGSHNFLNILVTEAYADQGLSPVVEEAALRRRDRYSKLMALQMKGTIGENKSGLVEIRLADSSLKDLVNAENNDRMVIYQAVAQKNGSSVQEVQKLYAQRLQSDAVAGTPIEVLNSSTGLYEWKIK
jgi:uncharacterized protein YdbL (DUF1318 family)